MSDELIPDFESAALLDPECPLALRRKMLKSLSASEERRARQTLDKFLQAAAGRDGAQAAEKRREVEETLKLLKDGPLRAALFLGTGSAPFGERRAHVSFSDNTEAMVFVPEEDLAKALRRGDTVWVDAQARALLARAPCGQAVGEVARIEKRLDKQRVSVVQNESAQVAWRLSADLEEAFEKGEIDVGSEVIGCPMRRIAFAAVNGAEGPVRYRFLNRQEPPAVELERDLGAPHPFIADVAEHVASEMSEPGDARLFGLGRSRAFLLTGPPGTGKSYSIQALWRQVYKAMSRVTGVPIEELPSRVLRLRPAEVLSKWLGESDKNLDRLFDEARLLADEVFVGPDGREHKLPVLVIGEEIESLGRKRGQDSVQDRVLATLLDRFEISQAHWRDRLVIFLFTTNVPQLVDPAMFRRAGGEPVALGGLNRRSFQAVLGKQLRTRHLRPSLGPDAGRALIEGLATWVFSGADDPGQVEVHVLGQPAPLVKHRRDLVTPALVQRAVERASQVAFRAWRAGDPDAGLDRPGLARALHDQVRSIVEHLDPSNVATYLDIAPDVQVRAVKPVRQAELLGIELEVAGELSAAAG